MCLPRIDSACVLSGVFGSTVFWLVMTFVSIRAPVAYWIEPSIFALRLRDSDDLPPTWTFVGLWMPGAGPWVPVPPEWPGLSWAPTPRMGFGAAAVCFGTASSLADFCSRETCCITDGAFEAT